MRLNRGEVAKILGVSLPTISRWVDEGMPVETRGRRGVPWEFDAAEVVAWVRARTVRLARQDGDQGATLAEAELRERRAKAALRELNLAARRAAVVPAEDARAVLAELAGVVRARFGEVGARLAPELVGVTDAVVVADAIAEAIDAGLRDLALYEPRALESQE